MSNRYLLDADLLSSYNQAKKMNRFEYDPQKSAANKEKHGIDFEEAQALWFDRNLAVARLPYALETRFSATGALMGKLWSAIFTIRHGSIRIISVRRAHKDEEWFYEESKRRGPRPYV